MRKELEELYKKKGVFEEFGLSIPEDLQKKIEFYESLPESETPIYDILLDNAKFPVSDQKKACIKETVEELLADVPNAGDPGLLLGRIQCGKTDTFEKIIGLAFDKGVDVAVVLTKGTNALLKQTVSRLQDDYSSFDKGSHNYRQGNPVIHIFDIHELTSNGIRAPYLKDGQKVIIVCMKQADNMEYLLSLFTEKSPHLLEKKVIVIDDEADFASRNYQSVQNQALTDENGKPMAADKETKLAVISDKIDDFRKKTKCAYLQVTATPYALYLQPGDEIYLQNERVLSFKPRFTKLVPTHPKYVGGKQFFEESQNEDSMYHELYVSVAPECIKVLNDTHGSYLNKTISSKKLYSLTYAVVSYLMATAIRNIQEGKDYNTSALVHVDISKNNHDFQKNLIENIIGFLKDNIVNERKDDKRLMTALDEAYESFKISHDKGLKEGLIDEEFPTWDEVYEKLKFILSEPDYINVQIVNSDAKVEDLLNKEGELQLHPVANIFIGGNILDRGITIKNMICFFYGRNPKSFQADTVLQHARFYGTRPNKDMAVTRLHTTPAIYDVMLRLHNMDEDLRRWFEEGKDKEEPSIVFIGYDKNIKPCSTTKIKVSKTISLKKHQYIVPAGFQVGTKSKVGHIYEETKKYISSLPNIDKKDENGFFEISKEDAMHILDLINKTYVFSSRFDNLFARNAIDELKGALEFCSDKSGGKIYALVPSKERDMNRIRKNGYFINSPEGNEAERQLIKEKATDAPVLVLIPEKGKKEMAYIDGYAEKVNIGWQDSPFFWPLLCTQENLNNVMFALNSKDKEKVVTIDSTGILDGIEDPNSVLKLQFRGNLEEYFGKEGQDCDKVEHRYIKKTTASRYILMNEGKPVLKDGIEIPQHEDNGVYSRNHGIFPFVLKPWKYMLLANGRSNNADLMLLEIDHIEAIENPEYNADGDLVNPDQNKPIDKKDVLVYVKDILRAKDNSEVEIEDENITLWQLHYHIKRVMRFMPKVAIDLNDVIISDENSQEED